MTKKRGRAIDGILLLDKPLGLTSNKALQTVKSIYYAQKAGHTGSLDPLATGMLPICFGEATKFSQLLLDADKSYFATAQLGVTTTTCDSEGEIVTRKDTSIVTAETLANTLQSFRGQIKQLPSMFSALKHQGKPLYKLARKGIEIERQPRSVNIYQLKLVDWAKDQIQLMVTCSKGTYIRNLVDDIGQMLGCGAHLIQLRRTHVAHFATEQMQTLDFLQQMRDEERFAELDQLIIPLETIAQGMPKVELADSAAQQLLQGQPVVGIDLPDVDTIALFNRDKFIGLGSKADDGRLQAKRMCKQ